MQLKEYNLLMSADREAVLLLWGMQVGSLQPKERLEQLVQRVNTWLALTEWASALHPELDFSALGSCLHTLLQHFNGVSFASRKPLRLARHFRQKWKALFANATAAQAQELLYEWIRTLTMQLFLVVEGLPTGKESDAVREALGRCNQLLNRLSTAEFSAEQGRALLLVYLGWMRERRTHALQGMRWKRWNTVSA